MNEVQRVPQAPLDSGKWVGRVVVAVILGEGIWGLLVSITNNLALPAMARIMGADAQSPLYLGKSDYNFAALFTAVLQLCFAGIVAVLLYSWAREPRRIRTRVVEPARAAEETRAERPPVVSPPVPPRPVPALEAPVQPSEPVKPVQAAPAPPPAPQPAKPAKPKKPKEVYYNIVGEPIESDDE
jgi:hypothetical protein